MFFSAITSKLRNLIPPLPPTALQVAILVKQVKEVPLLTSVLLEVLMKLDDYEVVNPIVLFRNFPNIEGLPVLYNFNRSIFNSSTVLSKYLKKEMIPMIQGTKCVPWAYASHFIINQMNKYIMKIT